MAGLLNLLVLIIIFGVATWLVNSFIPMPGAIKMLFNLVILVVLILYVLQFFGLVQMNLPMLTLFK